MKNFISKHTTISAFNGAQGNFDKPHVAYIEETHGMNYQILPHDYLKDYLTIVSLEDNNVISFETYNVSFAISKTISISTDNGATWTEKTSTTSGVVLATLNTGDKLLIKGSNVAYGSLNYYNYFVSTANFNIEGNIMSLIYGDNFIGQTTLDSSGYNFKDLFYNCNKLISVENLILPATILTEGCYNNMFFNCTALTITPELPATTLSQYCYAGMFYGCTGLTIAPELHSTTLAYRCYYQMFSGCTSLTTASELPATTLAEYCYGGMFYGCTSLTTAPELPATTLANYCYQNMFRGCTALTTAPELPATTLTTECYSAMFRDCTALTTAPELPVTTLAPYCYENMFRSCTSLNYVKCLATNISASGCTSSWLSSVSSSGTFIKDPNMSSWTTGDNGIPSSWTVVDAS